MDEMTVDQRRALALASARMRANQAKAGDPQEAKEGFGATLDREISSIPRQLGLTARYAAEGAADLGGIVADPLAAVSNKVLGTKLLPLRAATTDLLDRAGLPKPENSTERVVGDASRFLAGGGGLIKGAQLAGKAGIALASRPGLQAASAVGAGLGGGYARETGGGGGAQVAAALAGGLLAPAGVAGVAKTFSGTKSALNSLRDLPVSPQVSANVNNAVESAGFNLKDLPKRIVDSLEADAASAMKQGDLSPDALRRLVNYRLLGATPGRANLTLNPIDITTQQNLSKIGANSNNAALQKLALRQNENVGTLIGRLNEMGANTSDDAFSGGKRVIDALQTKTNTAKDAIGAAYDKARNTQGLSADIDPAAFTRRADDLLSSNLLNGALPADIRAHLNSIATGKTPLTVSVAEQLKTVIGNQQRNSADGNSRYALGLVRQALDEAPLLGNQGGEAISAFNTARGLNRNFMRMVEKTPALKAVVDGVTPDKFVQDFIIRGSGKSNVVDVARLKNSIKGSPEALKAVREQILSHLKAKATSGKPDEAMSFTQSGYNNAFAAIGERKLMMFFTKPEINQLKAVGKVSLYEQVQPSGAAVNNSNSGALAVAKAFDFIANNPIINKIPFAEPALINPAKNISQSLQARGLNNVPKALLSARNNPQRSSGFPLPLLLSPGLLEDRRN